MNFGEYWLQNSTWAGLFYAIKCFFRELERFQILAENLISLVLFSKASVTGTVGQSLQKDRQSEVALPLERPVYQDIHTKVLDGKRRGEEWLRVGVLLLPSQNVVCRGTKKGSENPCLFLNKIWGLLSSQLCLTLDTPLPPSDSLGIARVYCCHSRGVLHLFAIFSVESSSRWGRVRSVFCFAPYKWLKLH